MRCVYVCVQRVLVVGGGITGYHLSRSAITAGASKITMVTRRHIKVQHFDVSLTWAGRYKKVHYSKFFGLSDPLGTTPFPICHRELCLSASLQSDLRCCRKRAVMVVVPFRRTCTTT